MNGVERVRMRVELRGRLLARDLVEKKPNGRKDDGRLDETMVSISRRSESLLTKVLQRTLALERWQDD